MSRGAIWPAAALAVVGGALAIAWPFADTEADAAALARRALAALASGEPRAAEIAAERAAARGGPDWYALRDFLRGNAAFARCEQAEAIAAIRSADPTTLAAAVDAAAAAVEHWRAAAEGGCDEDAALRNVARALAKIDALRRRQAELERRAAEQRAAGPGPGEDPGATEDPEADRARELAAQQPEGLPDSADAVRTRLAELEAEKRRAREAQRRARSVGVERDW